MPNRFNLNAWVNALFPISWKQSPTDWIWGLIFFWAIPGVTWVAVWIPLLLFVAWKEGRINPNKSNWDAWNYSAVLVFLWMLVGALLSEPTHDPWHLIEQKLSWVVFPILIFFIPTQLSKAQAIKLFASGIAMACILMFLVALLNQILQADGDIWTGSDFTKPFHRSYWAAYAFFAGLYFLNVWMSRKKWSTFLVSIGLMLTVFLSESKAGVLMALILLPIFLVLKGVELLKISRKNMIGWTAGIAVLLGLVFVFTPQLNYRFQSALRGMNQIKWENNPSEESTQARLLMWNAAWLSWNESPWIGHGLADANYEMQRWNVVMNNSGVVESRLNAHNQFLQVMVQGGLIALILLGFWLGVLWFKATLGWMRWWWVIILISLLFEAFFETRLGLLPVMIFALVWKLNDKETTRA